MPSGTFLGHPRKRVLSPLKGATNKDKSKSRPTRRDISAPIVIVRNTPVEQVPSVQIPECAQIPQCPKVPPEVTLRDRKKRNHDIEDPEPWGVEDASSADRKIRISKASSSGSSVNKRNATYMNDEEYDEDLAQLDMLLHYVNNLSASLEFVQWEDNRISTDLMPTLLTMYDALYARLSETPNINEDPCNGIGSTVTDLSTASLLNTNAAKSTTINGNPVDDSEIVRKFSDKLYIEEEGDVVEEKSIVNNNSSLTAKNERSCAKCAKCASFNCLCKSSQLSSPRDGEDRVDNLRFLSDVLDKRLNIVENDYDIPEAIESGGENEENDDMVNDLVPPSPALSKASSSSSSYSKRRYTYLKNPASRRSDANGNLQVMGGDRRPSTDSTASTLKTPSEGLYRPLSSISSSSSSSSNSLPRGAAPPGSYLASVESLEATDVHGDGDRRRDRSLKMRREKALRPGSCDSGVQCHSISLPTPPNGRPRYCDPNLGYMDRVVLEIVETEEVYVRDLREVIQGYLYQWRSSPESAIPEDVLMELFSNIEQIYTFNRRFLEELEVCGTNPVLVAKCFVRNNEGFAIYTDYCTNYPRTVRVLTELMRCESSVRACRECQLFLQHTLPLGSYLLKPVQRILKYHLLLGNIVKNFDKDSPGYTDIWKALAAMTGMAHHINDMKRRHEHAVRVQEIQSLLYGWEGLDLTTFGELCAEGCFRLWSHKAPRHVFLFQKMILFAKKKDENILIYKTHILCSNLMLIESIPREPLSFHVIPFDNPRHQYTLECRNLDQKREWTQQLKRVILENYSAVIPPHAYQIVMDLGQAKMTDTASESRSNRRTSSAAPEYLERRKERRRVSEGGVNGRLRIRRSARNRKEKDEKEARSRSASRSRFTEEDEEEEKVPPKPETPKDRTRLKLPLWRRKSEPGVSSRGPLKAVTLDEIDTPPSPLVAASVAEPLEKVPIVCAEVKEEARNRLPIPKAVSEDLSISECEGDDDMEVSGENLEHIVSQILQHQLQMQKMILNKHRRGIISRKKLKDTQYETSDTEGEENDHINLNNSLNDSVNNVSICSSINNSTISLVPPLPSSPPPSLENSKTDLEGLNGDCIDIFMKRNGKDAENGWSSGAPSIYGSSTSIKHELQSPIDSTRFNVKPKSSDRPKKSSNYDNFLNMLTSIRGKSPDKRLSISSRSSIERCSSKESYSKRRSGSVESAKTPLRRIHSFNSEISSSVDCNGEMSTSDILMNALNRNEDVETKERPVTIAIYESSECNSNDLKNLMNRSGSNTTLNTVASDNGVLKNTVSDSGSSHHISVENLVNIHPEHKIYSRAYVNRGSIRKVLKKITHSKSSKSIPDSSTSVSSIYPNSENGDASNRKTSKLVSTMARQCSRTLKERIKQIRTEDLDNESIKSELPPESPCNILPVYKQGSSSIGARLATNSDYSDYAIPLIRQDSKETSTKLRPDSLLSSSSIWTSSSSSSSTSHSLSSHRMESGCDVSNIAEVKEGSLEDFQKLKNLVNLKLESPISFDSDMSGDSYYEKSFDAIETLLIENDIFRDSAIYSDPEENDNNTGSGFIRSFSSRGMRGSTLSPKSSFRGSFNLERSLSQRSYNARIRRSSSIKLGTGKKEAGPASPVSPVKPNSGNALEKSNSLDIVPSLSHSNLGSGLCNGSIQLKDESISSNFSESTLAPLPESLRVDFNTKKIPPPVPAKPDSARKKQRERGNLIQKQLKNLEESMKFPKSENSLQFEGLKPLRERRKELEICTTVQKDSNGILRSPTSPLGGEFSIHPLRKISLGPMSCSNKEVDLSRKFSVDSCIDTKTSAAIGNMSLHSKTFDESDSSPAAEGWVRHIVDKLQH